MLSSNSSVLFSKVDESINLFTLLSKNKGTVYLKPKETNTENQKLAPQESTTSSFPQTNANENEEVQRSELQSLRQSAVTMSAGQKEGASQIISDWLDESSSDDDSSSEEESSE